MQFLFLLAALGGMILYSAWSWGTVVYFFYDWFVQDVFTTLPDVNLIQAIGLGLFISLFKNHINQKSEDADEAHRNLIGSFLMPWIVLASGGLVYWIVF